MLTIAIVEDNADVLDDLLFNLRHRSFQVTGFPDGAALDAALAVGQRWPVLVLDLGLPGEDGLSIARRLRYSYPALGIIALTARGRVSDRIAGLNEGIDLYLVKPVDIEELAAAIRAVARRTAQIEVVESLWRLDTQGLQIICPDGERLPLTLYELQLLTALANSAGQTVSRDDLIRAMGKKPDSYDSRALEVMISRLRAKIGDHCPLHAVRGQGYRFTDRLTTGSA